MLQAGCWPRPNKKTNTKIFNWEFNRLIKIFCFILSYFFLRIERVKATLITQFLVHIRFLKSSCTLYMFPKTCINLHSSHFISIFLYHFLWNFGSYIFFFFYQWNLILALFGSWSLNNDTFSMKFSATVYLAREVKKKNTFNP